AASAAISPLSPNAGAFMVHVASSCPLAANSSLLGFDLTVAFNKNPLLCYDPDGRRFVSCDWGLLRDVAARIATAINNDTTWVQRAEARRRACSELAARFWEQTALRRTQPQVRIVPAQTGSPSVPVRLTCHVWGFYPPEVTIIWLHNGDIVGHGNHSPISAIPSGNWTYQTQLALSVAPEVGDTYTCSVQHASLEEPLLVDWNPGLTPEVTLMVAVATVVMVLGLSLLLTGTYRWRNLPPSPGYAPLPGANYPSGNS
ncbi:DMB protein, partial [Odontophorus gujanensis]|nr:DMB protein [Odontophorus gujanensis]